MNHIRLLHADDWVGLYLDKKLIIEGHSLDEGELIQLFCPDADFKSIWVYDDEFWESGRCPSEYLDEFDELYDD